MTNKRSITIQGIDGELYKEIKVRTAQEDLSLKDYVLQLIQKDLDEQQTPVTK